MKTGKTSRAFYETFRLIWRGLREFSRGRFCGLAPIGPDDVAKDAGKLADFIGLCHHSAKAVFRILGHDRIIGVTAGDNGPGLWIDFQQMTDGLLAAHPAWNREVHDHRGEWAACLTRIRITAERFRAVPRQLRFVPEPTQGGLRKAPNLRLVVHDQNAAA